MSNGMINEEQKQRHLAIRMRKIQEVAQAQQYLAALTNQAGMISPMGLMLKQQLQGLQAQAFDLDENGRLEIRSLPGSVPSPLAFFWQGETTALVLLWDRALTLVLPQRTALSDAAAQAGLAISRSEASVSQQPFLVYLVLAVIALTGKLPTPTQLQVIREVADPAEGKMPLANEHVSTREIRQVVASGFAAKAETIPVPIGLWNTARALVLSGLQAWQLKGDDAYHWGTFPTFARPHQDLSWNQRLQLTVLAGMVATPERYATLPIPPAPGAVPEEIWVDSIALASGPSTPDRHLRPAGLGAFGYSMIENNPAPLRLALSYEHGQALISIAEACLAEAGDRPPRYIGRILELDLPTHLLPQLRPWGIGDLVVQIEQGGMYVAVRDHEGRSMAAAWWKADASSAERVPLTYTPASWLLLHPIFASVWHDLKADGVVLEKPDLQTQGKTATKPSKTRHHKHAKQKIYLPPVRVVTKARWGSDPDRNTLQRATAGGHGYRRLPEGWKEREQSAQQWWELHPDERKPALLRRRDEAAQRAIDNRYPPPPPGFTYIAPYLRGGKPAEEHMSIPSVRARGLFSLMLGLQTNAIEPLSGVNLNEREP